MASKERMRERSITIQYIMEKNELIEYITSSYYYFCKCHLHASNSNSSSSSSSSSSDNYDCTSNDSSFMVDGTE